VGGGATELIDDVVLARAPIDVEGALDLLGRLRTVRRLPDILSPRQREMAAGFVAGFSAIIATAPWLSFTFEINPLKVGTSDLAAVDALLIVD